MQASFRGRVEAFRVRDESPGLVVGSLALATGTASSEIAPAVEQRPRSRRFFSTRAGSYSYGGTLRIYIYRRYARPANQTGMRARARARRFARTQSRSTREKSRFKMSTVLPSSLSRNIPAGGSPRSVSCSIRIYARTFSTHPRELSVK